MATCCLLTEHYIKSSDSFLCKDQDCTSALSGNADGRDKVCLEVELHISAAVQLPV